MKRSNNSYGTARNWAIAVTLTFLASFLPATGAFAQNDRDTAARAFVTEFLAASHTPKIYSEFRNYMRNAVVPVARDVASGKIVIPEIKGLPDAELEAEFMAVAPQLEIAADEFDAFLTKHGDELTNDLAGIIAKQLTVEEIEAARGALRLELARKGFDAFYKMFSIAVGLNYDEEREGRLANAWLHQVTLEYNQRGEKPRNPTPTPEQIAAASSFTNEIWAKMHIDKMMSTGVQFVRVAVMPFVPDMGETAEFRAQVDMFEQQQASIKMFMQTMLTTMIAQNLTDEQFAQLIVHTRTAFASKVYQVFFEMEQAAASVTQTDAESVKLYIDGVAAKGLFGGPKNDPSQDLQAFGEKWGPRLMEAISPASQEAVSRISTRVMANLMANNDLRLQLGR